MSVGFKYFQKCSFDCGMFVKYLCLLVISLIISTANGTDLMVSGGQSDLHREKLGNVTVAVKRFHSIEDYNREMYFLHELKDVSFLLQPIYSDEYRREITFPFLFEGDLTVAARLKSMSLNQLAQIAKQIVKVVGDIHNRGILHLDIKPENILLDQGTSIRLIDVGLAHPTEHAPIRTGTPQTMSPESLGLSITKGKRKDEKMTEASDWWSVGVTIFYLFMRRQVSRSPQNDYSTCHFKFYPYRLVYGDDGHVLRMEWPETYPPFPESLLKLLYGSRGLLALDASMRMYSGEDLLSHPFFKEYAK